MLHRAHFVFLGTGRGERHMFFCQTTFRAEAGVYMCCTVVNSNYFQRRAGPVMWIRVAPRRLLRV